MEAWCRPILARCTPERALAALRSIYESEMRFPDSRELIRAALDARTRDRWITYKCEVIRRGNVTMKVNYSRKVEGDDPAESYLKPGETLVADTATAGFLDRDKRVNWSECEEGRQFMSMLRKWAGPRRKRAVTQVGEILPKPEAKPNAHGIVITDSDLPF